MAIDYTEAEEIPQGSKNCSSRIYNKLAQAFNDRICNGVGDPAWRIAWSAYSFTRQIRNSNGALTFPPTDEWLKYAAYLDTEATGTQFGQDPGAAPAEAANVNNPIAKFVFGNSSITPTIDPENERLHSVPAGGMSIGPDPVDDGAWWALGKTQRGLTDGSLFGPSVLIDSPSFRAATSHYNILPNRRAKMNMSYGGFFPTPEIVGVGTETDPNFPNTIMIRRYDFTPLGGAPPVGPYYGFGIAAADTGNPLWQPHLEGLWESPIAYILKVVGATTLTVLSKQDYVLGPFTGASFLEHTTNPLIGVGMHQWSKEIRGTAAQRTEKYRIRQFCFENEKFWRRQYLLAPARGVEDLPANPGVLIDDTPTASFSGSVSALDLATWTPGAGTSYVIATDFVGSAYFINAPDITGTAGIEVLLDGSPIGTHSISSGDQVIKVLNNTVTGTLSVRATTGFTANLPLEIEVLEQIPYKPFIHDEYLVTRSALSEIDSIPPGPPGTVQVTGEDFADPIDISRRLFEKTAAGNFFGSFGLPTSNYLSENSFYQEMRKFLTNCVRMVERTRLLNYYTENGKSVIELNRHAIGDSELDIFEGIEGALTTEAPIKGFSNEWVIFFSWLWYDTGSGTTRLDNYPDILGHLNNPAHLKSIELNAPLNAFADASQHFVIGRTDAVQQSGHDVNNVIVSEAPSGYTYAKGMNKASALIGWTATQRRNFYKSAQIYRKPYKIESIEDIGSGNLKITLTERIQSHTSAPATVPTLLSYDKTNLYTTQDYATDENRLMKYLVRFVELDTRVAPPIIGDYAPGVLDPINDQYPTDTGCIIPRMHMVKLVEKVHEDDNDIPQQPTDTRTFSDPFLKMTFYLQCMCEGFIDKQSTNDDCVNAVSNYDYTFHELLRQANGTPDIEVIPDVPRGFDNAFGHGPLPGQTLYAEQFNQFVRAINLLTEARVDLPLDLESQETTDSGTAEIGLEAGSTRVAVGQPPYSGDAGRPTIDPWIFWDVNANLAINARRQASFRAEGTSSTGFVTEGLLLTQAWRIASGQEFLDAIPSEIADMVDTDPSIHMHKLEDHLRHGSYVTGDPGGPIITQNDFVDGVPDPGNPSIIQLSGFPGPWGDTAPFDRINVSARGDVINSCERSLVGGDLVPPAFLGNLVMDEGLGAEWQNFITVDIWPAGLSGGVFPAPGTSAVPYNATIGNGQISINIPLV